MDLISTAFTQIQAYLVYFAENIPKPSSQQAGFTTSFLAILVSQVGDKTFFLAMIMATRYNQLVVFLGSYGALLVMTVLSTAFGKIATAWISPLFTNIVVTLLFFYFGVKMILDSRAHQQQQQNEEMKQVEHELQQMETKYIERHSGTQALASTKHIQTIQPKNEQLKPTKPKAPKIPNSYILTQAFVMTFLAEWGDRSQIATIALAASFNPYAVTFGALLGHMICTAAAVKLGYWISGKITEKQILLVGGIVFIISGLCTAVLVIDNLDD